MQNDLMHQFTVPPFSLTPRFSEAFETPNVKITVLTVSSAVAQGFRAVIIRVHSCRFAVCSSIL